MYNRWGWQYLKIMNLNAGIVCWFHVKVNFCRIRWSPLNACNSKCTNPILERIVFLKSEELSIIRGLAIELSIIRGLAIVHYLHFYTFIIWTLLELQWKNNTFCTISWHLHRPFIAWVTTWIKIIDMETQSKFPWKPWFQKCIICMGGNIVQTR